jgi:actin-related protein
MELEKFRFILFNSDELAIDRANKLSIDANFNDGVTTKYCSVIKIYNSDIWIIPVIDGYEYLFTTDELNSIQLLDELEIYG